MPYAPAKRVAGLPAVPTVLRHCDGPLISAQGRKVFLAVCAAEGLLVLISCTLQQTFNPIIGVFLWAIGMVLVLFGTSPARCYYSPLIFAMWFHLGCVLSFVDLIVNEALHRAHPNPATAAFAFTDGEMWTALTFMLVGVGAVVATTIVYEKLLARGTASLPRTFRDSRVATQAVAGWIVFSLLLSILLIFLQIGRTGLVNKTDLPFHLAGLLSFTRSYVVPSFGLVIVDLLLNGRHALVLKAMFVGLLVVGLAGSIAALSRGYMGFLVISLSLYFVVNWGRHRFTMRTLAYWILGAVPLLLVGIFVVNTLREKGFSGQELSLPAVFSYIVESRLTDLGLILTDFFNLAVGRIGGLQELLGALSAPHIWDAGNPWYLFVENEAMMAWLQRSVLGFTTYGDASVGFGYSFSLWGSLALSGSLWIVFLGTAAYVVALLAMEEIFFRIELPVVALVMAVNVGFQFWGFANKTICSNLFGIVLIIYIIARFAFRSGRWLRFASSQEVYKR